MATTPKKPDLESLSLPELRDLEAEIKTLIAEKEKTKRAELVAEFQKRAEDAGIAIADILPLFPSAPVQHAEKPKGRGTGKRGVVAPKYRNPADGTTWSGRGRQPAWVQALIANGGRLEDVLIATPTD